MMIILDHLGAAKKASLGKFDADESRLAYLEACPGNVCSSPDFSADFRRSLQDYPEYCISCIWQLYIGLAN